MKTINHLNKTNLKKINKKISLKGSDIAKTKT